MINHIKRWWYWQKQNGNNFFYKILVLFHIANSPTFNQILTPDEAKAFHDGFMEGLNSCKGDENGGNKNFHCGVEESGFHAYNCNDCPNKCEEYYRWDKEIRG